MKKHLPGIIALLLFYNTSYSQYCGYYGNLSGPTQCTANGNLPAGGFTPNEDIPCINRGQMSNTVFEVRNWDTISFNSQPLTIQSLRIDSIGDLPDGLCWVSDVANNTYLNSQSGCIKISGITNAPPGQYKITVLITINVGVPVSTNIEAAGVTLYLRVVDQSSSFCPPVDTSQHTLYEPFNGIYDNVAKISGKLYYDGNQNGTYDNGEIGIPGKIVTVGNTYVAASNALGNFNAYVPAGIYTLKPDVGIFDYTPDSIVVNAATVGNVYSGNNFGAVLPVGYCEGSLSIIPQSPPPRPGFNNHLTVLFHNSISASPISQTIKMTYNGDEVFVSAIPTPTIIDTVARFMTWDVINLSANSNWTADIKLYTPQTISLGTVRYYSANILNSNCDGMDTVHTRQEVTVVGSYDPNDKAVSPAGYGINGHIIPSTDALTYTIRFQNTGTYPAENVKVVDTMSVLVNMATFKLIASSHPCEVIMNGREVTFAFNGIQLADSFNNEPMSHGYIQYSINPKASFVHGSVIENLADIYFDFNAPIRTNTAKTTGDINASIRSFSGDMFTFNIYPNPNSGNALQLQIDPQLIGKNADLMDVNGKLISRTRINAVNTTIAVKDLSAGVYLIKVEGAIKRLIIE